jgi:hypothetical protein
MREVNQLFTATFEELRRQRTLVMAIDSYTQGAMQDMSAGNFEFEKAEKRKKCPNACAGSLSCCSSSSRPSSSSSTLPSSIRTRRSETLA